MSDILDSICDEVLDEIDVKTLGMENFPRGELVELHSLKKGAYLNSKQGWVIGPAKDEDGRMNGRLVVKLDAGRMLSIKATNLRVVQISAADMKVRKAVRELQNTFNETMMDDVMQESFQSMESEVFNNPAKLQLFMDHMQQLTNPATIQQLTQQLPQNLSRMTEALQSNPSFQQFGNAHPQMSNFLNQMVNVSKVWQSPQIAEQLPKVMESNQAQLQKLQNDPKAALEMMKKSMEELREQFKRRDPDHFSPNAAVHLVKMMGPFVCVNLKWHQDIFAVVVEFLVDPRKRDSQKQPF